MTYAGLEIFPFRIDWTQAPNGQWSYDLNELAIGFGPEIFDPIQNHVTQAWTFNLQVRGADVLSMATFRLALKGKANPFWLPDPQVAFRITAGVSTTQFDIAQQNAATTWSDNPANVLYFEKDGETSQVGVISTITDNTTSERVTLTGALSQAVDKTWTVKRLRLVRNLQDRDRFEFMAEGWERHSFNVVEIAEDYGDIETASAPITLFQLSIDVGGTPVYWRYTSYGSNKTSDGNTFTAAPIDLIGALSSSTDSNQDGVTLEGDFDSIAPLRLHYLGKLFRPILLEAFEVQSDDLDTRTLLFKGYVTGEVSLESRKMSVRCTSWTDGIDNIVPNFPIQEVCPYKVYDAVTCKVDPASFQFTAEVTAISGSDVTVTEVSLAGLDENELDQGWIQGGTGAEREELLIIASTAEAANAVTLTLTNAPENIEVGDTVTLTLGCNGQRSTCVDRFDNLVNFGGGRTPLRNLAIEGLPINSGSGGKGK